MDTSELLQLYTKICEDMQEPISYLPMGILAGIVFLAGYRIFQTTMHHNSTQARPGIWFICVVYMTVLLNMVFFSREPGSRTGVELRLFGTWGNNMMAHRFVLENVMMFFPFGVLLPSVIPHLRKGRWCTLAAFGVGVGIELIQFLTRTGYCQLDDVVANTLGAWIGWLILLTSRQIHSKVVTIQGYLQEWREKMIAKIKALCVKYEEIIAYLIVGVLTTIVSWAAKFLANALLFHNTMYPTPAQNFILSTINWTAGVIFAYFTNRKFVFKSHDPMRKEAPKFVLSRVSTWILDIVIMQIFTALGLNLVVGTIISAVLVTIANYVFSKLFVFQKK